MSLNCPRCGRDAQQDYYGPCDACRTELRASMGGEARVLTDDEYVPKMNVTPNAVAVKE